MSEETEHPNPPDFSLQPSDFSLFLSRHAKPYDPATDDYEERPVFAADTKEGKNDPIYNAHSYHTKVPPRSIIPYILHYTRPGDLVLDLFCGSGMTGVAAQMCVQPPADLMEQFPELKDRVGPRACILNDLSPAACHIAYNYNTPVDVAALQSEFERIKAAVKDEFDWLYGTEHYEPAVGVYDPANAEVASRLKTPPTNSTTGEATSAGMRGADLFQESVPPPRNWELINKAEVEKRLGYPVTKLPRADDWGDLDIAKAEHWVCIPATIQYTIWSDVYRCEGLVTIEEPTDKVSTRGKNAGKPIVSRKRVARGCGAEIVLWDTAVDHVTGEVHEMFNCPKCAQPWKKTQIVRGATRAVAVNYNYYGIGQPCQNTSKTQILAKRRYERKISDLELARLQSIGEEPIPYWFPTDPLDVKGPQYNRNALSARKVRTQADFYTHRNLRALARLWQEFNSASSPRLAAGLKFVWTSIYNRCSRRTKWHRSRLGQAALSGQLYIPSLQVENNILLLIVSKLGQIVKGLSLLAAREEAVFVSCNPAGRLTSFPPNSIDYIFSDPPFGSNIYYSEVNLLWEAWLGRATDQSQEAVVHRKNDRGTKTIDDYARLMQESFAAMYHVLKPGRWATIEFNNSDGAVFEVIKQAIRQTGFEIANMLLLDKEQKTFKQVKGAEGVEDVVDKDVLFNLHKPAGVRAETRHDDHDLEQQLADAVREHLQTLPERMKAEPGKYTDDYRTTATINSTLMNVLIPRGVSVERLNLPFIERVCARYFRKVGQHWYLRGEAAGGNGGQLVQEEIAIKDELTAIAWLRQKLAVRPMLIGELKPLWMRATGLLPAPVSQALALDDLLTDNFWRDPASNRWREPTAEERERMNDDRSLRVLHDAGRFVNGTFNRKPSNAELCEWIGLLFDTCRELEDGDAAVAQAHIGFDKTEGYEIIVKLSHRLINEGLKPAVWSAAQKQAKVAGQRLAAAAPASAAPAAKARKDDSQTTLDLGG